MQPVPINDLDSLPFPDYTGLNDAYSCPYVESPFAVSLSSRGCPHGCIFCSSHLLFGRRFRARSATNVVEELVQREAASFKTVWFYDDTFTVDRTRVINICHLVHEYGTKIGWKTQTRADCLDRSLLYAMADAGCVELGIGVESGNQDIISRNGKALRLTDVKTVFTMCRDAGIRTVAFFMLGMAHETRTTVRETVDFALSIDPDLVQFTLATPYPGTVFHDLAVKEGWLTREEYDCSGTYALTMNDITPAWLEDELRRANRRVILRRRSLMNFLQQPSVAKVKAALRLVKP